jgi:hypothetical protein
MDLEICCFIIVYLPVCYRDENGFGWMPINRPTLGEDWSKLCNHEKSTGKRTARTKSKSATLKPRAPRSKAIEKDASDITRKRSGSALGRVSKRTKESGPETLKTTDDMAGNIHEASVKKLEAFRHKSDAYEYADHQGVSTVPRKTLMDDKYMTKSGMPKKASPSNDLEPWLLDGSDVDDPFEFMDFGNYGNTELSVASEKTYGQLGNDNNEGITLSSEQSSLPGPKAEVVIRKKEPQHSPFFDPFDDLEDADFSALDEPEVNPSQPNPSARAKPHKPIVRPLFPQAVRDRSLVIGVSATTVLRTCFRIGEALRAGSSAVHNNTDVVIELYARVSWSAREETGSKQHFRFVDLFHDRPPYLKGMYDLWKGSELWDSESRPFLDNEGPPKLCRCIGKMRRDGKELLLTVFNVRKAS